ncbi:hypothetical protein MXMO3_01717 [Maritalea myrionectae]|uniref:Ribbon-helix-helix protein CopG domain-containing protein n=2 Tax=Maritalea myrionectae TaxID=454601 RepID=A0A2R4ME41_9HYPH|nr:hypothetical protein MXMO3_01717 [Maritalea myrionectae]
MPDNNVTIRLTDEMTEALDSFRKEQQGRPSRPDAIRRILTDYFISTGKIPFEDDEDG